MPRIQKEETGFSKPGEAKRKSRSLAPVRDHLLRPRAAGKGATGLGMTGASDGGLSRDSASRKVACWTAMLALILYGIAGCAGATSPPTDTALPTVLWSAGMETGDLSEWFFPSTGPTGNYGGDIENSGTATAVASTDVAHTGKFSAKLTITTPGTPDSGARLFRWQEPRAFPDLHYRAWYYFPEVVTPNSNPAWWNVMQWKSAHLVNGQQVSDPAFVVTVGETTFHGQPTMYFYLCPPGVVIGGPGCQRQMQAVAIIPPAQWVELEAHYVCAGDNTGHVTIWQNGSPIPLFDIPNVQTRYSDGDCEWSVNNYSNSLNPSTATIYVDDAAICSGNRCTQ